MGISYVFLMLTQTTDEERIPFNEGYKRSNVSITNEDLGQLVTELAAAS